MKVYCLFLFLCLASVIQILKESYPNVIVIIMLENTYIAFVVEAFVLNFGWGIFFIILYSYLNQVLGLYLYCIVPNPL